MGAAKQRQQSLEAKKEADNEYYGLLLNEALGSGKINKIPNESQSRFEVLNKIIREEYPKTSEVMRNFRARYRSEESVSEMSRRNELKEKYTSLRSESRNEQKKFISIELLKVFESPEFQNALNHKIQKLYDLAYVSPAPFIKLFTLDDGSTATNLLEYQGFDVVNTTKKIIKYKFNSSNENIQIKELVKWVFLFSSMFDNRTKEGKLEFSKIERFLSDFLLDNNKEFGELQFVRDLQLYYTYSIVKTANPIGVPDNIMEEAKNKLTYKLPENPDKVNEFFSWLGSLTLSNAKYLNSTNKIDSIDNFIDVRILIDNFISQNDGYLLPKEQQIPEVTIPKRGNIEEGVEYYELFTLEQLTQKRREISSEENNSGEKCLYNTQLAQQLDQLIQSRYRQLSHGYTVIRKKEIWQVMKY